MPITITIDELRTVPISESHTVQHAEITISDGTNTYAWRRGGINAGLGRLAVQALLDSEADALWLAASSKQQSADVFDRADRIGFKLVIAVALVVLDEINALRLLIRSAVPAVAALPTYQDRTLAQLKAAIRNKLQSL
jgi:GAF domain-containing protein